MLLLDTDVAVQLTTGKLLRVISFLVCVLLHLL
jgi:hypothetical protein